MSGQLSQGENTRPASILIPQGTQSQVIIEEQRNGRYSATERGDFHRITLDAKRQRSLLIARASFTTIFLVMLLIVTIVKNEKMQVLAEGECLRDYTFVWTESVNTFLVNHVHWKDFAIIQSSIGIDGMMISYLFIFAYYGSSMRLALSLAMFYPARNVI